VFDAINFEPLSLSEVGLLEENNIDDAVLQEAKFTFTVYGRTDTRIFGVPTGHYVDLSKIDTD
jgi:hypothetical protein